MSSTNRVMVSIPKELKARLDRLAMEMMQSYERGNGYQDVAIAEQGTRGTWIPLSSVIAKALDELEGHRTRSNRKRVKTQPTPA
jgi:hypothetical protein